MGKFFYLAYYLPNGFQKTESSRSTLKTVAQEMLRDRLEKIRQGLYCETPPRKVTFESLAADVVNDHVMNRRRSTRDVQGRLKNHLRPFFGHYLATGITTELVKEYILLRRSEGAADGSTQLELALLKRLLNLAYRANKIARVPYIPVPRSDNVRRGFIEQDGYVRLLAALPDYLRPQEDYLRALSHRKRYYWMTRDQIKRGTDDGGTQRGTERPRGDEQSGGMPASEATRP